jgi:hypothetical protein
VDTLAGRTISAGDGLSGGGDLSSNITLSHGNTSDQASVSYSGGTVLSGVGLDEYGHIISFSSVDLDSRYLSAPNGVIAGNAVFEGYTHLFGTGGKLGITLNDGQGNLNLTFNHAGGVPDQDGSACRITTSVDNTTGSMTFQIGDFVFEGISTTLSDILSLTTAGATFHVPLSCTSISGDGSLLNSLNASNITSGTVSRARLPGATTSAPGIVQLSNSLTSTSQSQAATSLAVKTLQDDIDTRVVKSTTISTGAGLVGGGSLFLSREIAHADTSSQQSVTNSNSVVIQSIEVDQFGHVTSLSSVNLDVFAETDSRYLQSTGGTMSGALTAPLYYGALDVSTQGRLSHIQNDGALYRYDGQVYITVDDNFYIRDSSGAANTENYQFHFDTNTGTLTATGGVVATTFSGSGAGLTNLPAGELTGSISSSLLPTGTTSDSGLVQLSDSISESTTLAATPSAVKSVKDSVDTLAGRTISAVGNGLSGGGNLTSNITLSHANTSNQTSVSYTNGMVVSGVGLDEFGHVTSFSSVNLDERYLSASSGVVSGNITVEGTSHLFGTGGKLGITLNDGQGDLNLTFNHAGGVPDQDGSACRITTSVDNASGSMTFQIGDGVFQGVSTTLSDILSLTTTGATFSVPLSCTTISGNGSLLSSLNADNITSGTVSAARLPGAVVDTSPGIVQLSDSLTSDSQTTAATSLAVKTLRNNITSTTISTGGGLSGGGDLGSNITLEHGNTSDQASVSYSGGVVLSGVGLDEFGHVTSLSSVNLDDRYLSSSGLISGDIDISVEGTTHLFGTSGKFGITLNDGQGDLNLTFNHAGGVPDQDGSACRITTSVDNTIGSMTFQVGDGVFEGISTTLSDILSLTTTGATFSVPLSCTTISGDGSLLSSLNADNITSGTVSAARLPGAVVDASPGIVQLSDRCDMSKLI